jgi:hypothetical protein
VYDVRPDSKDHMRIRDMATKAKDRAHMLRLAMQMAKSIKDAGKAYRRGAAAADAGYPDVARVFYDRCDELAGFTQDDAAAKAERERQEQRARAERERARQKAEEQRRKAPPPPPSSGGGAFDVAAIRRKLDSAIRLRDGAKTPGEFAAASAAVERLQLRLRTMRVASTNRVLRAYLDPILRETWED